MKIELEKNEAVQIMPLDTLGYGCAMDDILDHITLDEVLAQLAEEAAELAQAALKLRRCYDGMNPTPADPDRQYECLLEEIGDVELYLDQLSINRDVIRDYKAFKLERWKKRLEGAE
jgi:NTP pyrophosphatase (non-canonical NTP hydrolase)